MKILLTICFRKGSKRLPDKNIKILHGKKLYEWTWEQATKFKEYYADTQDIDIVLCTDYNREFIHTINSEILWGYNDITFLDRPVGLSGDTIPKLDIIKYILNKMETKEQISYDCIVDLDVTAPLRMIADINNCVEKFDNFNCQTTLFSVTDARRQPWFNQIICSTKSRNIFQPINKLENWRCYDMNASIYVYNAGWLSRTKSKTPIQPNSILYFMKDWQAFDIDNQNDFNIVEFLFAKHILKEEE